MELPFDAIYTIGRRCDPKTRVNLCLASKDFFLSDIVWLHYQQQVKRFALDCMEKFREIQTMETNAAKVKGVHRIFRFLIENKDFLKHPLFARLRPILKPKLEEFGKTGMCKRKAKKYMIELDL